MSGPSVSVVVPVFNGESYLENSLFSIFRQDCDSFEVIVVDDGSTDGTAAVAAAYAGRLRYVSQPNFGAGRARNHGVEIAYGRYLAFLDCDDLMLPGCLGMLCEVLDGRPELDMAFAHVREFLSPEVRPAEAGTMREPYLRMAGKLATNMLVRRESFLRVGGFSTDRDKPESLDWYSRAEHMGLRHVMLPDVLWERRLHGGNQSKAINYRQVLPGMLKEILDRNRRRQTS